MSRGSKPPAFGWTDWMLVALILIWGANFAVVKSAVSEITPLAFNAVRFGTASLLILLLVAIMERDLHIPRSDWGLLLLLGFISTSLYQTLFITGIARTRASNASLILATVPVHVALIGTLTRSEQLRGRNWVGLLVSLAGLFLLIGASSSGLAAGSQTLLGDLLILAATVLWSIHTVLLKRLTERHSALKITAWLMLTGTPLLVMVGLPDVLAQDWQSISRQSWLGLAYSAVLAIALGYVIWNVGVQRIGGARTSVYSYLNPLISVVVSWAFLGESMQPLQAIGAAAILLGVVLGRSRPKGRAHE